jgi:mRNA interferase MazF
MPIREHPPTGTILVCDFETGFEVPEMVGRRPVVVVSPRISVRAGLCTVVPLSTTTPRPTMPYHLNLDPLEPPLPPPFDSGPNWVKGDMVYAVSLRRLDFLREGKDATGHRIYREATLPEAQLRGVRACILAALGLAGLTRHL